MDKRKTAQLAALIGVAGLLGNADYPTYERADRKPKRNCRTKFQNERRKRNKMARASRMRNRH